MDDNTKTTLFAAFICVVVGLAALFMLGAFGSWSSRIFGTYREETRTQVYEQSRTYNQGMAVDLDNLCREWRSEPDVISKEGLADTIRLRAARYDSSKLPTNLQRCLEDVK